MQHDAHATEAYKYVCKILGKNLGSNIFFLDNTFFHLYDHTSFLISWQTKKILNDIGCPNYLFYKILCIL